MNKQLIKLIAGGVLLGLTLFFAPFFLFTLILFFITLSVFSRLFGWRRHRGQRMWAYADHIRGMSDDEYAQYKNRYAKGNCAHWSMRDGGTQQNEQA